MARRTARGRGLKHDSLRTDNRGERLPVVSGSAGHRQDHSAVVRRLGGRVDRVHAVLSDGAAAGVSLCPCAGALSQTANANAGSRGPAAGERAGASGVPQRIVETIERRRAHAADSGIAGDDGGAPLFSAVHHRAAATGVVLQAVPRRHALPVIRALECRLDVRAAELPGAVRAGIHHAPAGLDVVGGVWRVCGAVRGDGLPVGECGGGRDRGGIGSRRKAVGANVPDVAAAAGGGFAAAAGHHQPPFAKCGGHSVPVGAAAEHLPADVHPVL